MAHGGLPASLVAAVKSQNSVLFLGAGASYGANHPKGAVMPSGNQLRDLICDRFLGGSMKNRILSAVAEFAANDIGLIQLQSYVYDLLRDFQPADFHRLISTFRWRLIATTNYDLLVDRIFPNGVGPLQHLVKQVKDNEPYDARLRMHHYPLPFLKLHGCIEYHTDESIPLILGQEQYAKYIKNRNRLYMTLRDVAYESPVIFCGYSIEDAHIQQILFDLTDMGISRPMFYNVNPGITEYETRYWARHRVACVNATFQELLESLDAEISKTARSLAVAIGGGRLSIRDHYRISNAMESLTLENFMEIDVDHIRKEMSVPGQDAREFYKGADTGFGCIVQDLDVKRVLSDSLLVDIILRDSKIAKNVELHVITGPAGNGKTITLKRLAWEAANSYGAIVFYLRTTGVIRVDCLKEIFQLTGKRIFLCIDAIAQRKDEVSTVIAHAISDGIQLTIIGTERDNEWSFHGRELQKYVVQEYEVRYLSEKEIESLIHLLDKHDALGILKGLPFEDQRDAFLVRAQRQLLVALHEATLGISFESILKNEFEGIPNEDGKTLYLAVCAMNQFGAPVRSGLVNRITGVSITEFHEHLLEPLKSIVFVEEDKYLKDSFYRARHQHIAEIVFNLTVSKEEERYEYLERLIGNMNLSYNSDKETFDKMTRGSAIAKAFPTVGMGRMLLESAQDAADGEYYILQQRAVFEMRHPNGSLDEAAHFANAARETPKGDRRSVLHTQAEVARKQANASSDPVLKKSLRSQARSRLTGTLSQSSDYDLHTRTLLALDEFDDLIAEQGTDEFDKKILESMKDVEEALRRERHSNPDSIPLLTAEARYMDLIDRKQKAEELMEKALERNPKQDWLALRLANRYSLAGSDDKAIGILKKTAAHNPTSREVHLSLGRMYMRRGDNPGLIIQHLRSSFAIGDQNFEARFWYGRELYIQGNIPAADDMFDEINHDAPGYFRMQAAEPIRGIDQKVVFYRGSIQRKEDGYAFVKLDQFQRALYTAASSNSGEVWSALKPQSIVRASVSFNRKGARATSISKAD